MNDAIPHTTSAPNQAIDKSCDSLHHSSLFAYMWAPVLYVLLFHARVSEQAQLCAMQLWCTS